MSDRVLLRDASSSPERRRDESQAEGSPEEGIRQEGTRQEGARRSAHAPAPQVDRSIDLTQLADRIALRLDDVLDAGGAAWIAEPREAPRRESDEAQEPEAAIVREGAGHAETAVDSESTVGAEAGVERDSGTLVDAKNESHPATAGASTSASDASLRKTDEKLQSARRRLVERKIVALRRPPKRTPFWQRAQVRRRAQQLAWGVAIVALSALASILVF